MAINGVKKIEKIFNNFKCNKQQVSKASHSTKKVVQKSWSNQSDSTFVTYDKNGHKKTSGGKHKFDKRF